MTRTALGGVHLILTLLTPCSTRVFAPTTSSEKISLTLLPKTAAPVTLCSFSKSFVTALIDHYATFLFCDYLLFASSTGLSSSGPGPLALSHGCVPGA